MGVPIQLNRSKRMFNSGAKTSGRPEILCFFYLLMEDKSIFVASERRGRKEYAPCLAAAAGSFRESGRVIVCVSREWPPTMK